MRINKKYDKAFEEVRTALFDLINYIDIKIDIGYILEELEEISYKIEKIDVNGVGLAQEIRGIYDSMYKKYQNKLASFLSDKEARKMIKKIEDWLKLLPSLF